MKLGDTFLPFSDEDVTHLWIVITDPDAGGLVAIVSLTTRRSHSDVTCLLQLGDHPFVRHESVIAYQSAKLVANSDFDSVLARNLFRAQADVSAALLKRIQNGAIASIFTPRKVKLAVARQLGLNQ